MTDNRQIPDESNSVSLFISQLKERNPGATQAIWNRFFQRLLPLASSRLRGVSDRVLSEEDILVSVFDRFFSAAAEGRFAKLQDRDDLWQILLMLMNHRIIEYYRHANALKRGGGLVDRLEDLAASQSVPHELADLEPGPEVVAAFNDSLSVAIASLTDEKAREVAVLKLEGYENTEIAAKMDIGLSSVERKLRLIRESWKSEFNIDVRTS